MLAMPANLIVICWVVDTLKDSTMKYNIVLETTSAQLLAAVRAEVRIRGVAQAWKPALDQVWAFLKSSEGLHPGHNLFLYHHPEHRGDPMQVDFGVRVARRFTAQGTVHCVETPAGEIASTVHIGPYDRLSEAHEAIHGWCEANNRRIARTSWEIYGDWNSDPALLETKIQYLLA
jgi:effector-binding domain-containing protein